MNKKIADQTSTVSEGFDWREWQSWISLFIAVFAIIGILVSLGEAYGWFVSIQKAKSEVPAFTTSGTLRIDVVPGVEVITSADREKTNCSWNNCISENGRLYVVKTIPETKFLQMLADQYQFIPEQTSSTPARLEKLK